jgi:hypothetical protein
MFSERYITNLNNGKIFKLSIFSSNKKVDEDITIPISRDILLISGNIQMSYEAILPMFELSGHEHRLLLFIMAYCANKNDNKFSWNHTVADDYAQLYKICTGKDVKVSSVRIALSRLNQRNIIQKSSKGAYTLNPLYSARRNEYNMKQVFNTYAKKHKGASSPF